MSTPSIWTDPPPPERFVEALLAIEELEDRGHSYHRLFRALYSATSDLSTQELLPLVFPNEMKNPRSIDGQFKSLGNRILKRLTKGRAPNVKPPLDGNEDYSWAAVASCYRSSGLFRYRILGQLREALEKLGWVELEGVQGIQKSNGSESSDSENRDQANTEDQERRLVEILVRRGQPEFRENLIAAYDRRCAVTGCNAIDALEAAHIEPYSKSLSNAVTNGLLLRADIHTLFDLNLIRINPETLSVALSPSLLGTTYEELEGKRISIPADETNHPDRLALAERWKECAVGTGRQ